MVVAELEVPEDQVQAEVEAQVPTEATLHRNPIQCLTGAA